MSRRRGYRPFGARLVVTSDDTRVHAACDAAIARFPRDAGVHRSMSLAVTTVDDSIGDPAWPSTSIEPLDDGLVLRCGSARLEVDHRHLTASAVIPRSLMDDRDAVRVFVEGAMWSMLIGGRHLFAVHAAFVAHGERAIVLRGASGAGKSTLTYAALRSGWSVVSDDWSYAVASRRPFTLYGSPWRMFLMPDNAEFFPELAGLAPVPHPSPDRFKLAIEPPLAARRTRAEPDAIVFVDPATDPKLFPIGVDEAVERFWSSSLPTERTGLPPWWVDQLLDRPRYVLQRGTSPDAAVQLLESLR